MIEAERQVLITGTEAERLSQSRRYDISSLNADAAHLMPLVRHHWHTAAVSRTNCIPLLLSGRFWM
jgi:hypothetical protein